MSTIRQLEGAEADAAVLEVLKSLAGPVLLGTIHQSCVNAGFKVVTRTPKGNIYSGDPNNYSKSLRRLRAAGKAKNDGPWWCAAYGETAAECAAKLDARLMGLGAEVVAEGEWPDRWQDTTPEKRPYGAVDTLEADNAAIIAASARDVH